MRVEIQVELPDDVPDPEAQAEKIVTDALRTDARIVLAHVKRDLLLLER